MSDSALWHAGLWGPESDRGPDPLSEYEEFRAKVLRSVGANRLAPGDGQKDEGIAQIWERPICEVLLDQRFFNGVGNYVRAELLWLAKIPPFTRARDVLGPILVAATAHSQAQTARREVMPSSGACASSAKSCHTDFLEAVRDLLCTCVEKCGDKRWLSVFRRSYSSREVDNKARIIWYRGDRGLLPGPEIVSTPWETLAMQRLPASLSPAALRLLLNVFGNIDHITHHVPKRYAFVRFRETQAALRAKEALEARPLFKDTSITFKRRVRRQKSLGGCPDSLAMATCKPVDFVDVDVQGNAVLREIIEDEEEQDSDLDGEVDRGDLPIYQEQEHASAGGSMAGPRPGKRKRVVDWAGKHACVGVGSSMAASLKGFRSLGRVGGRLSASSARDGNSVCEAPVSQPAPLASSAVLVEGRARSSSTQGDARAEMVQEARDGGDERPSASGLSRLLSDLNRASQQGDVGSET